MNDLEKFKKNVDSLEVEMANLSKIAEVYKKVSSMAAEFEQSVTKMKLAQDNLNKAIADMGRQKAQLDAGLKSIEGRIDAKSEELKVAYRNAHNVLAMDIELKLSTYKDDIKTTFRNENGSLVTKMDSIKSEMLNESLGLKNKISTMSNDLNSTRQEQAKASELDKLKILVIITLVVASIAVACGIVLLVK